MAQHSMASSPPKRSGVGRIFWWFFALGSFALLLFLLASEVMRFSTPAQLHRLQIVQDIPLPDALPDPNRTSQNPFASGQAQRFDHFDFQSLDPNTHLLFIVHTGPNPDKEAAILHNGKSADEIAQTDGNIVVFNTQLNKVVGLINVPQAAGVMIAPDLHKVFIGDAGDGIIYIVRIDAITNKLIIKIPFGLHPPFGDDIGHVQFDPVTHRIFVVTLPLIDQNSGALQTPPSFLALIDPVALKVVSKVKLPDKCLAPHGLVIDAQQREAFVACVDSNNLARVDLQTMQAFPGTLLSVAYNPDIVRLDRSLHLLFVGSAGGISIFDESRRGLKKLGDYFLGGGSHHTIAIDEATQLIYLPQPSVGDRPILRVIKYVANGV